MFISRLYNKLSGYTYSLILKKKMVLEESDDILVAYFSWSGNTAMVAKQIHNVLGGDIFEICAEEAYSSVYRDVVNRARQELREDERPELMEDLDTIASYDTIFIGYPNWCNTFPAPVLTFLSNHDFSGKTIIPFCTHGGGGIGNSLRDFSKYCTSAKIVKGLSLNGNSVIRNNSEVIDWIEELKK